MTASSYGVWLTPSEVEETRAVFAALSAIQRSFEEWDKDMLWILKQGFPKEEASAKLTGARHECFVKVMRVMENEKTRRGIDVDV